MNYVYTGLFGIFIIRSVGRIVFTYIYYMKGWVFGPEV